MSTPYHQLLAQPTPPPGSSVRSSFLQKCLTNESTKKGLSFNDPGKSSFFLASEDPSAAQMYANEGYSNISGVFELENSRLSLVSRKEAQVSRGEFDTTIMAETDSSQVLDSLFENFLEFFISYSGLHQVFSLLEHYENLCNESFEAIAKQQFRKNMSIQVGKFQNVLRFLQLERNTWRLLRVLFQDRMASEGMEEDEILPRNGQLSDKQIMENLYQKNAYIRQSQLIVDWLEKNADDEDTQLNNGIQLVGFTDNCLALEHSLNELMTSAGSLSGFVEIDPDAQFRHDAYPIHEADKANQTRIFKFMFTCIRAGKLDEAQRLAEKFGEAWLAAALEGWRLFHDPNYDHDVAEGEQLLPLEGNKYRDLWKAAAWQASNFPKVSVHEQALYGSLCGHLKSLLRVSKSWEDYLWSYMRTTQDKLIEREIRGSSSKESFEELPADYWDKMLDIEEIFQELEASDSSFVKEGARNKYHLMQKYIILDDMGALIEEMYHWTQTETLDSQILRCMTHVVLFLRLVGRSTKEELCVPIIEAYVQELIKLHRVSLVALYTSTLPKEQQIMWYSKFLEGITERGEREQCLQWAEEAGLDVPLITRTVVNNIREREPDKPPHAPNDLTALTTEDDLQKIHAIDWLIFSPSQRPEAMKQANALMRYFVAQRKLEAAKLLFSKIPEDSVAIMMQLSKSRGFEELSADEDNTTREYLCFKAYLEANDAFNTWFSQSMHARPKEPVAPSGDHVTFKDKVAHEHELQQYKQDLQRWQNVVTMLGETASECLYNVLLFVNGGWMVDQRSDGTPDESRRNQMVHLRKLCIPHIARLLQDLLISEGRFKEAIQLADVVASERYQLYKEFTHDDLKTFMRVTLDSSLSLLDKNMEPLGYHSQ